MYSTWFVILSIVELVNFGGLSAYLDPAVSDLPGFTRQKRQNNS
jgi:hypothetical protein